MISIRTMHSADIPAGLSLCRASGWNQLARDWEIFLAQRPDACSVAVDHERVVGTVATRRYGEFFSWIGMVLVDPAYQRQGIGMRLLKEALRILENEETVKLDATPAGREVYLKLDFVDEYPLLRMHIAAAASPLIHSHAQPITAGKLDEIAGFDQDIFGANRKDMLTWMWHGAPHLAFYMERDNEILGYCMGRPGARFHHVGPVIAKDTSTAKELFSAALVPCAGKPLITDVLRQHTGWNDWLSSIGFSALRPLIRMYKGTNRFPGLPANQFSILGPEFG